jgi:hypothetical protein
MAMTGSRIPPKVDPSNLLTQPRYRQVGLTAGRTAMPSSRLNHRLKKKRAFAMGYIRLQPTHWRKNTMTTAVGPDTWVYIVVQNPEKNEQIIGQHNPGHNITYIPAFLEKNDATMSMGRMAKQKGSKLEIQAIIFEDLLNHAKQAGFMIFFLDEEGSILMKYSPAGERI